MTAENSQAPSPALSDDELRETLDLLSTVMASVSDRVDSQTQVLDRVNKTATEARQAAFAAQTQTDPERYGEMLGRAVASHIGKTLNRLDATGANLSAAASQAEMALTKAEQDRSDAYRAIWERERKVDRVKASLPWFGLGAVVLAVAMTVGLPRVLAGNGAMCIAMGAEWTRTTSGREACVFYGE